MAEQNRSLFGWQLSRKQPENVKPVSFTPDNEDGAFEISPTGGYFGQYMDLQGDKFQNDKELIMKYRTISQYPEVDLAVEDIWKIQKKPQAIKKYKEEVYFVL